MNPLVLASASPRRAELVRLLGFEFEIDPSDAAEETVATSPEATVVHLAERKARRVAQRRPDHVVIGADTVVALDGIILGKPEGRKAAVESIRALSGRTHDVHTGLSVVLGASDRSTAGVTTTRVTFRTLDEAEIQAYVDTDEPYDKAGAYGIQGRAAVFVEQIDGCYYNVVGLPVADLYRMLRPYQDHLRVDDSPTGDVVAALREA